MRHLAKIAVLPVIAAGLASLALMLPDAPPVGAATTVSPEYVLVVNSGFSNIAILAQGRTKAVAIGSDAATFWDFVNALGEKVFTGQVVKAYEIRQGKTSECLNDTKGSFHLHGCKKGATSELFWRVATGSKTGGSPNYWYINVSASRSAKQYMYVTAKRLGNGAELIAQPAGAGGRAAWNRVCAMNC